MSTLKQVTGPQTALIQHYSSVKGKCAYNPDHHSEDKTLLKCAACKAALYCGFPCQKSDWPRHKLVCKILKEEPAPPSALPTPIVAGPKMSFLDQIGEDLKRIAIQTIQEIARQNQTRMEGYARNPDLLDKGVFTPLQYYKACMARGQQRRLPYLDIDSVGLPLKSGNGPLYNGYLPSHAFHRLHHPIKRLEDPVKNQRFGFDAKESLSATYALDALLTGPSLLESVTSCQAAYWKAIQGVLREKFDPLFNGLAHNHLILQMSDHIEEEVPYSMNPLKGLITTTTSLSHKAKPGQFLCFSNISAHQKMHSFFDDGIHYAVLCTGEKEGVPLFTTLGLNPEGEGSEEMTKRLFDRFREDPVSGFPEEDFLKQTLFQNDPMLNPNSHVAPLLDKSTLKQIDQYLVWNAKVNKISNSIEEFKNRGGGKNEPHCEGIQHRTDCLAGLIQESSRGRVPACAVETGEAVDLCQFLVLLSS